MYNKLRQLFLASGFCFAATAMAQNEQDAIAYSQIGAGGTARMIGMGGSFSAIGADPSAAFINPAGIATLRRNEFTMGVQLNNVRNNAEYLGSYLQGNKINFNIPNIALSFANVKYDSDGKPKKTGLANVSYGFGINQLANYHSNIAFDGINTKSSITDYFAESANAQDATPFDLYLGSMQSIAYSAGAIENLLDGGGNQSVYYVSRYIDSQRNSEQTGSLQRKGSNYESQFSLGLNFSHKIYLGLGLMYTTLRNNKEFDIYETDRQTRTTGDLQSISYNESIYDRGNGFGAKLGGIFRPNDQFRLALAVHTPKTYSIKEEYGYKVTSVFDPGANVKKEVTANTDPLNTYNYKVTTPARLIAGLGFIMGSNGLFNIETEFYNYASAKLKASDYAFIAENTNIAKLYKSVIILRMGVEFNIPDKTQKGVFYRVRFGYANYPSSFSSKAAGIDPILKKATNMLSGGFGYREKDYYIDFALAYGNSSNYFVPYATTGNLFPSSSVTNKQNKIGFTVTMGFNFE